eukprot:CAMPEP_0117437984 /NCGR_PEP_ID=MMETSP0759-20121206/1814_1 /TAXON_ID=63605 /ORGANISM="Percolomonas cosmopolitus, Strain WS" /LENGTH=615 /DNA_ID=CAMNT_0005229651 /DNA_START=161 /DNA_END=2005 /DNA_ORIENTATION=-
MTRAASLGLHTTSLLLALVMFLLSISHSTLGEQILPNPSTTATIPNPLCLSSSIEMARDMIVLLCILFTCFTLIYLIIYFKLHFLPECLVAIGIGCVVGLVLKLVVPGSQSVITQMDPQLFFVILLPAIIFDAGYSMQKLDFFRNAGSIMMYAFVGTFLSTVCVAVGLYAASAWFGWIIFDDGKRLPMVDAFMFGALICAVDPVATLAIFKALNVNATLHYLVFGESVINDAVAIVLFETFKMFREDTGSTYMILLKGLAKFLLDSVGSVLLGTVFSLMGAFFFKVLHLRRMPHLEIVFFFIFAYVPYLIALPYLSGIVTVLTSAIIMSYYVQNNLSKTTQHALEKIFHSMGFFAETFVFLYIGMALFAFPTRWNFPFIILTLVLIVLSRAVNVFPLTAIVNTYRKRSISLKNQLIMWVSGLRGAIAFALAIQLKDEDNTVLGDYIFSTTMVTVLFTIIVFGGGTWPILKIFKVKSASDEEDFKVEDTLAAKEDPALAQLPSSLEITSYKNILVRFDENILRRLFLKQDVYNKMKQQAREAQREIHLHDTESEQEMENTAGEVELDKIEIDIPDESGAAGEELEHIMKNLRGLGPERRRLYVDALKRLEEGDDEL